MNTDQIFCKTTKNDISSFRNPRRMENQGNDGEEADTDCYC